MSDTDKAREALPPIPRHPEPHTMRWSRLEEDTIQLYAEQCFEAGRQQGKQEAADSQAMGGGDAPRNLAYERVEWNKWLDWYQDQPEDIAAIRSMGRVDVVGWHSWLARAALAQSAPPAPNPMVGDLVSITTRLVRALRKTAPEAEAANKAMDYIKRHGLMSPLRCAPPAPSREPPPMEPIADVRSGSGEEPSLPEPAFNLTWRARDCMYVVSIPNVGYADCFLGDQMHTHANATAAHWKARAEAAEKREAAMRNVGAMLGNIAYNLSQREGKPLTADVCDSMRETYKAWDALPRRAAIDAEQGEAP